MAACGLVLSFAAAMPMAVAQSGAEAKPLAEIVFSSYDELMKDVDFIGNLGGHPQASQMIDQTMQMFTQNKGLAGLDKSKPIGVIVQSMGDMPAGAICIPVTDLNALLDVAKGFGVQVADAGNGLQSITTQQGQTVFVKNSGGWALISIAPDMLNAVPADPSTAFGTLADEYDLGVRVHVQNVPESYREMAIQAMSEGARQGLSKNDEESDEQFKAREEQMALQLEELKRFFNELDQFTFGMSVDDQQKRAYMDFAYTAIPGTKLAADVAANSNVTTNFAGFERPNAAATLSFASKVTEANAAQMDQMSEQIRTTIIGSMEQNEEFQDEDEATREKAKSAVNDFVDALKATMQAGTMDGGASLSVTAESLTFVAGGFVADPSKVESGLKKISEIAQEKEGSDVPDVKWAASKHKDVKFHTMAVPVPEDNDEARQLFGESMDLVVGIGQKAVYFAAGRQATDTIKQVIDASAAAPNKAIAPVELNVALGQIMNAAKGLADEDDKPRIEEIANMLSSEAEGRDHVRIVAQPIENGIRMRLEAEEGVLRAIGMGAQQQQAQGAGR
jgi:hypothetical protein